VNILDCHISYDVQKQRTTIFIDILAPLWDGKFPYLESMRVHQSEKNIDFISVDKKTKGCPYLAIGISKIVVSKIGLPNIKTQCVEESKSQHGWS
jgi:hypothetical protein